MDFYGFNGYETKYNDSWTDDSDGNADYRSRAFYAYDRKLIDQRIKYLRKKLPAEVKLHYAVKANPMPELVNHLADFLHRFLGALRQGAHFGGDHREPSSGLASPRSFDSASE